jgi:hypothetical protein
MEIAALFVHVGEVFVDTVILEVVKVRTAARLQVAPGVLAWACWACCCNRRCNRRCTMRIWWRRWRYTGMKGNIEHQSASLLFVGYTNNK